MAKWTEYRFHSVWHVEAPVDDVCSVLRDVATYPQWWPEVRVVTPLGGGRHGMVARSFLPYDLHFVSEERPAQEPGVIEAGLSGDLEGTARWTVTAAGGVCRLVYDQHVVTHKRLLDLLAPVARPAFRANHWAMMRHGQAGLRTYMAGFMRGASTAAA